MTQTKLLKWVVTIVYLSMIAVNAAAVLLPLNGVTTQEVSDSYPNLFAPSGLTFSIWSVIYLFLAGFVIYQWIKPDSKSVLSSPSNAKTLGNIFIVTSILNSVWLIAWQYFYLNISVIIMLFLLLSLIYVNQWLAKLNLIKKDYLLIKLPFSIYFGWITIATIANITAFFVDKNIPLLQEHQVLWTVIILCIGALISCMTTFGNHDIAYGLTTLWAYFGILMKHLAEDGWNRQYPQIITTVVICLVAIALACAYVFFYISKRKKSSK